MAKLSINSDQATQIVDAVDQHLERVFAEGAEAPGRPNLLAATLYYTSLVSSDRSLIKDCFRQVIAAVVKVLNIDRPLPSSRFTGTVILARRVPLGTEGSLTVTDGMITGYTPPT